MQSSEWNRPNAVERRRKGRGKKCERTRRANKEIGLPTYWLLSAIQNLTRGEEMETVVNVHLATL